ncbi:iduronate 2-sulfatase isoform X2 [Anabrus simplex]|uniref:iduronate 2-sulfatase isoform X2 n=1 Tax=Anabrus simplex TaxID=316456 RepID=UPI0035A3C3BF
MAIFVFTVYVLFVQIYFIQALKPNVLFVIVDDLRPALGCYGDKNAFTPYIDSFSLKSIKFNNAFVQQALCAPSRNSLLTGRRPDTLHLYDFYSYWRHVAGNFTTLPQYFKENGYHTVSIGKVFHPGISSNWSDDQPYSWSEPPYHPPSENFKEAAVCRGPKGKLMRNLVCPVNVEFQPGETLPDLESLDAAVDFLERVPRTDKKPFFLTVGFHKPHVPLKFPKFYLDFHPLKSVRLPSNRWQPPSLPLVAWNPWTDVRKRDDIAALNISFPFGRIPDNTVQLIRQGYYAAVTYIDYLFGQLVGKLMELKLLDETIVVLTGDHGWSLGEHGEWSKYSNFDVAVRVPLLVYVPHMTEVPLASDALVELVDIFPSLVDLTNVSMAPPLCPTDSKNIRLCTEGISFVPLIRQAMTSPFGKSTFNWKTGVFSQYPRPGLFPTQKPNSDKPRLNQIRVMGYSLRTLRHRYTEWARQQTHT